MFEGLSAAKAMVLVQDLQLGRKSIVELSDMQIVYINFSMKKAHESLSEEEFNKVKEKFDKYVKMKTKRPMTKAQYYARALEIISDFEIITPYYNLTEDPDAYNILVAEREENRKADKIVSASINFMNGILSYEPYWEYSQIDRNVIIAFSGWLTANLSIFAKNGLIDDSTCRKAIKRFDKYIADQYLKGPATQEELDDAFYGAIGITTRESRQCCDPNTGIIDMGKFALIWGITALIAIFDSDEEEEKFVQRYFKMQEEIFDGNTYRSLMGLE